MMKEWRAGGGKGKGRRRNHHRSFSALSAAVITPPLSLACVSLSSASRSFRARCSFTTLTAVSTHCSRSNASAGGPPSFFTWHISPWAFAVTTISPLHTCSSRSVASNSTISRPFPAKNHMLTHSGQCSSVNGTGSRSAAVKTVTCSPCTDVAGRRKWASAPSAAIEAAVRRDPSCDSTWIVSCSVQTAREASRHKDSVGSAEERRSVMSRWWVRVLSREADLRVWGVS